MIDTILEPWISGTYYIRQLDHSIMTINIKAIPEGRIPQQLHAEFLDQGNLVGEHFWSHGFGGAQMDMSLNKLIKPDFWQPPKLSVFKDKLADIEKRRSKGDKAMVLLNKNRVELFLRNGTMVGYADGDISVGSPSAEEALQCVKERFNVTITEKELEHAGNIFVPDWGCFIIRSRATVFYEDALFREFPDDPAARETAIFNALKR